MEIHVYNTNNGNYIGSLSSGDIGMLMLNVKVGQGFTLAPPPGSDNQWRWIDDKWVADET